ncbi:4'-phosphopantetheinyl transferase superfamily protein [Flammeovirga pectinis]|uniref:4'-phosphopantetheinyl transferase superfamily protein n=1 Tax=Flammeovirga pectinis TaxID=2494373 RepID=A0A3Q9FLW8_9BACT|nr:4'-phosphopantetheinyl transferase superfamily protein [Flammeovirga pectinis]AZQ62699.1 4'-phosphopantetheinyl transferase superfamily protein [Flammeovirga pectinis]
MEKGYKLVTTSTDAVKGDISLLDGNELKRYKRFIKEQKKEEFLIARTFLKYTLAKELGILPKQLSLSYTDNGKPYLSPIYGEKAIFFNISHSNGYIVIVLSDKEIGVDVEPISQLDESKLKWFLSSQELKEVQSIANDATRKLALFHLFTMKEAFIKATDKTYQLGSFNFWYINKQWVLEVGELHNWKFDLKTIGNEIAIAVCYQ